MKVPVRPTPALHIFAYHVMRNLSSVTDRVLYSYFPKNWLLNGNAILL